MTTENQNLITLEDACIKLALLDSEGKPDTERLKRKIRKNEIECIKIGGDDSRTWRIDPAYIEAYIKKQSPTRQSSSQDPNNMLSAGVRKAKEERQIAEEKALQAKAEQETEFSKANVADAKDLQIKLKELAETAIQFGKERAEYEANMDKTLAELKTTQAQFDTNLAELKKREEAVSKREEDVATREQLSKTREELLSKVEKQQLQEEEVYNSTTENLKRNFAQIFDYLWYCAIALGKLGFSDICNRICEDLNIIDKYYNKDKEFYTSEAISRFQQIVADINNQALYMAQNGYDQKTKEDILYNLDRTYELIRILKPAS